MTKADTNSAPLTESDDGNAASALAAPSKEKVDRREIKGGLPYSTSPGVFKNTLEQIVQAERPDN